MTLAFSLTSSSTIWEPTNPAPPVTRIFAPDKSIQKLSYLLFQNYARILSSRNDKLSDHKQASPRIPDVKYMLACNTSASPIALLLSKPKGTIAATTKNSYVPTPPGAAGRIKLRLSTTSRKTAANHGRLRSSDLITRVTAIASTNHIVRVSSRTKRACLMLRRTPRPSAKRLTICSALQARFLDTAPTIRAVCLAAVSPLNDNN